MNQEKKINFDDILLSIFIICTTCMIMVGSLYSIKKNDMDRLTNELYSWESIRFKIENTNAIQYFSDFMEGNAQSNYTLFKEGVTESIRGIYTTQKISNVPMKEGRFFQKDDFFQGRKLAVIGKEYAGTEDRAGKKYINYQGDYFEVIGIIGGEVKSKVDYMAYLNIDALFDSDFISSGIYVLDSNKNTQFLYSKLVSLLAHKDDNSIFQIESNIKGTGRLFGSVPSDKKILVVSIIIVFIMNILFASYWVYKKRILIAIQKLVGHKFYWIYGELYKKYVFISCGMYTLGILLFAIFNMKLFQTHLYIYGIIFVIGLLYNLIFAGGFFLFADRFYTMGNCIKELKST